MSPHHSNPAPSDQGWRIFNVAAMAMAIIALIALIIVLVSKWVGGAPWPGFNWIAMIALPAAFLMMGSSVIFAVARRRRL